MRTLLTCLVLTLAPAAAFAACGHDRTAMSCSDGTIYDADQQRCVPTTG